MNTHFYHTFTNTTYVHSSDVPAGCAQIVNPCRVSSFYDWQVGSMRSFIIDNVADSSKNINKKRQSAMKDTHNSTLRYPS